MTLYMKFVSLRPKFIISFMIGVDLFSGAGGLSLGAEMSGGGQYKVCSRVRQVCCRDLCPQS